MALLLLLLLPTIQPHFKSLKTTAASSLLLLVVYVVRKLLEISNDFFFFFYHFTQILFPLSNASFDDWVCYPKEKVLFKIWQVVEQKISAKSSIPSNLIISLDKVYKNMYKPYLNWTSSNKQTILSLWY